MEWVVLDTVMGLSEKEYLLRGKRMGLNIHALEKMNNEDRSKLGQWLREQKIEGITSLELINEKEYAFVARCVQGYNSEGRPMFIRHEDGSYVVREVRVITTRPAPILVEVGSDWWKAEI